VLPRHGAHLKRQRPQTGLFAAASTAGIDDIEMNRTFNNGIGMVVVVDAQSANAVAKTLRDLGETVFEIGTIAPQGAGAAVVLS
jgi:phosphoribosylformylglycinamidine cyclo-ligase